MTGSAWAIDGDSQRPLTEGAPVYEGEEIVTENDSNVEIRLADNTVLGQGEDSAIRLDDYVYSGDDGSLDFHMVKGVFRVVSGEIVKANPEGFNLTTPMATIGIRGTEIMVQIDNGREIIGVDKMGEGHHVVISNAFNEVIIDKAGMFSGVDFDGSLIVPDDMPDSFIESIIQAAPLTLLGDAPRLLGDPQEIIPPQFFETISNESGDVSPGVGMRYASNDPTFGNDSDDNSDEVYELTEEEIEQLLQLETAAGGDQPATGESLDSVVDTQYSPFGTDAGVIGGTGTPQSFGGLTDGGTPSFGTDTPPVDTATAAPATAATPAVDVTTDQTEAGENEPVSYNVLGDNTGATLVDAVLDENSDHDGEVEFDADGTITYTPADGEDGTVVIDYTIEGAEGEISTAHLSITLADDSEPTIEVDDATAGVEEGVVVAIGSISTDFGGDLEGSTVELSADGAQWDSDSQTLTYSDGDTDVWSITLTDSGYEFTQYAALPGSEGTLPGESLTIDVTATATDGDGDIATGTFTVTVTDEGPTADDVVLSQETEDTAVSYNVFEGESATAGSFAGTVTSAVLADGTASDRIAISEDGSTITYTPAPGEEGTVTINYTVTDSLGDTATASMTITLAEDSEPVINAGVSGAESGESLFETSGTLADFGLDAAASVTVTSGDASATWDGDSLVADTWTLTLDGNNYTFTQTAPFDHTESDTLGIDFTVTATDSDGSVTTGTFTVSVADDAPTAEDVTGLTQEAYGETVTFDVLGNSVDAGADGIASVAASMTSGTGSVSIGEDGSIIYTPAEDSDGGQAIISYTVTDGDGDTATASLTIGLADAPAEEPPNDEPSGEDPPVVDPPDDIPDDEPDEPVNLLVNGDFSNVSVDVDTWIGAKASSVEGWDAGSLYKHADEGTYNDETIKRGEGQAKIEVWQAGYLGVLDPDGSDQGHFVEIDYAGATDFIAQTVATVAGLEYTLSFSATIRPDGADGETLLTHVYDGDSIIAGQVYSPEMYDTETKDGWTTYSLTFTATGDETTIRFGEPDFGDEGNVKNTYGVLLDNVSLVSATNSGDGGQEEGGTYAVAGHDDGGVFDDGGHHDGDGHHHGDGDHDHDGDFAHWVQGDGEYGHGDHHGDHGGSDIIDHDIMGTGGDDLIFGGDGDDTIDGVRGEDTVYGGDGNDLIFGSQAVDHLYGDDGMDTIDGGQGDDILSGGADDDILIGGHGDDILNGGTGADTLTGGPGHDTFVFTSPYDGTDHILDFNTAMDEITLYEWGVDLNFDGADDSMLYHGPVDYADSSEAIMYLADTDDGTALYYNAENGDDILVATVDVDTGGDSADNIGADHSAL